jgi:hypothetical protein
MTPEGARTAGRLFCLYAEEAESAGDAGDRKTITGSHHRQPKCKPACIICLLPVMPVMFLLSLKIKLLPQQQPPAGRRPSRPAETRKHHRHHRQTASVSSGAAF